MYPFSLHFFNSLRIGVDRFVACDDSMAMAAFPVLTALTDATALDPVYYTDPAWYAFERKQLFTRHWHYVGHIADLSAPGDHIVADVAGVPLIIVCQPDGYPRAFHNVCRHRAGPIATANGRGATRLRCLYHGWQYGLDGALIAAPEMAEAIGFDKATIALTPVACNVWEGLVFVALGAAPPLADVMAGIAERIKPTALATLRFHRRDVYDVAANWKVYIDNYLEGYHLPYVHPALTQVVDYADYSSELATHYSLQLSPITDPDGPYGDGTAYYYFIYPNLMLNVVPGRLQLNRVVPTGIDTCRVDFEWYFADDPTVHARIADDLAFTDTVQREDAALCAHVQRGLTSGHYIPGRLSPKREAGVWHFQNLLRQDYAIGA
jgi:choline monooxygenase